MTAEGAEFCKIMEYIPAEKRLLVRAGVGWGEGVVGKATVGADLGSPAGYALQTGKPVISNHLENEERFRTPELLVEHGIRRAMNVILQGGGLPFGVLEVDSRSEGEFGEHDIAFTSHLAPSCPREELTIARDPSAKDRLPDRGYHPRAYNRPHSRLNKGRFSGLILL